MRLLARQPKSKLFPLPGGGSVRHPKTNSSPIRTSVGNRQRMLTPPASKRSKPCHADRRRHPASAHADKPENGQKRFDSVPLGRLTEPSDVAAAALYLALEEASFITGGELPIDGGRTVYPSAADLLRAYSEMPYAAASGCARAWRMSRAGGCPNMRPYSRVNCGTLSYPTP